MIRMNVDRRSRRAAAICRHLLGCAEKKEKVREERVPVTVAVAEQKDIPVQVRAIGSVQPISTVAVRALVAGQLQRVWFREGEDVRKGQLLFTIDPRPYQAALAQAQANLARDEAQAAECRCRGKAVCGAGEEGLRHPRGVRQIRRPAPRPRAPSSRQTAPPCRTPSCNSPTARSARRSTAAPAACRSRPAISSKRTTPRRSSPSTRSRRSTSPSPFPSRSSATSARAASAMCRCPPRRSRAARRCRAAS